MLLYIKNIDTDKRINKYYEKFKKIAGDKINEEIEYVLLDTALGSLIRACCITKEKIYFYDSCEFRLEPQLKEWGLSMVDYFDYEGVKVNLHLKNHTKVCCGSEAPNQALSNQLKVCNKFLFEQKKKKEHCSIINNISRRVSDIIKEKITSCGEVTIALLGGKPCTVWAVDDRFFASDKLPEKVDYQVFDIIYDLLKRKGGKVEKGLGRGYRVGEEKCNRNTIMGTLAYEYYGKQDGESTLDPVFVLAAILDWANIARNCRGYIELI